jgi:hypothetical protein
MTSNISNRDIDRLYDKYNPGKLKSGDRVIVTMMDMQYFARIVGLDLDIKNKKMYANLRILTKSYKSFPTRVDISDCAKSSSPTPMYSGHHKNS